MHRTGFVLERRIGFLDGIPLEHMNWVFPSLEDCLPLLPQFRTDAAHFGENDWLLFSLAIPPHHCFNFPALVLHLVPFSAFTDFRGIDLAAAMKVHELLRPLDAMGFTPSFNFDGFINFRGADTPQRPGYTQLFRNGIIEAVLVGVLRNSPGDITLLPSKPFERHAVEAVPNYLKALAILEVTPPIVTMITLDNVRGAYLGMKQDEMIVQPPPPFDRDSLFLPEVVFEEFGSETDQIKALKPAFDALWNAAGRFHSPYFDASGRWVGGP
jgi:hypothetical protein